ncbi:MAG TPA: DUF2846 domain-containing protein [Steroidobacteraceae bacterium]|nr:DUF2846 domain-containing protein [Steroidobacteraceae bacterium]
MIRLSSNIKVCVMGAMLALAGCATTGNTPSKPKPVHTQSASTKAKSHTSGTKTAKAHKSTTQSAGPVISANPTQATIVFFRPWKFAGGGISFKVREAKEELGKLSNGSYFVSTVPPGAHTYVVHSEAKDELHIEVEAGQVYYVEGTMSLGVLVGHPNLSPSDAATFDGLKAKLKNSAAPSKA